MFEKITTLFQSKPNIPDLIAVLDLAEWYRDLSAEERQKLHQYSTSFGTGGEVNLLEQSVTNTSETAQEYLKGVGATAASENEYEFAEQMLPPALEFACRVAAVVPIVATTAVPLVLEISLEGTCE